MLLNSYQKLTNTEKRVLKEQFNSLVDLLDDKIVKELISATDGINQTDLFNMILGDIYDIVFLNTDGIKSSVPDAFPQLKAGYELLLCVKSLPYFVSKVLPEFDIRWFHLEWFNMIQTYKNLAIIASRDAGKSYTFSFATILWKMFRYSKGSPMIPSPRDVTLSKDGMLITNEFNLAKRLLKKVRTEIEENPILRARLLPDSRAETWGSIGLSCKNGASITLSSFYTSNRGPHVGYAVVDDFLDRSVIYSSEARNKFKEVFRGEITQMILPGGQFLVVGTPFAQNDLYSELKKDKDWVVFEYPALFPDGSLLFKERYGYDELASRRHSLGADVFAREFLCKPISASLSVFTTEKINKAFKGMEKYKIVTNRRSYGEKLMKVAIGADFAISTGKDADSTSYTVVGTDFANRIHLVGHMDMKGADYREQLVMLINMSDQFDADVVVIEVNGFQRIMAQQAREMGLQNIMEFQTNGFNKKDLLEGVPSIAIMLDNGELKMPRGDAESIRITDQYCDQLSNMVMDTEKNTFECSSGHDDDVMSLFLAIKGIKANNEDEIRISSVKYDGGYNLQIL